VKPCRTSVIEKRKIDDGDETLLYDKLAATVGCDGRWWETVYCALHYPLKQRHSIIVYCNLLDLNVSTGSNRAATTLNFVSINSDRDAAVNDENIVSTDTTFHRSSVDDVDSRFLVLTNAISHFCCLTLPNTAFDYKGDDLQN
jgi:hypothetical protein